MNQKNINKNQMTNIIILKNINLTLKLMIKDPFIETQKNQL